MGIFMQKRDLLTMELNPSKAFKAVRQSQLRSRPPNQKGNLAIILLRSESVIHAELRRHALAWLKAGPGLPFAAMGDRSLRSWISVKYGLVSKLNLEPRHFRFLLGVGKR